MGFEPSEDLYKEKLNEKLNLVYLDNMGGQSFRFQDLFYLFKIDEGQVAFQSYSAQMEFAHRVHKHSKKSLVPGQKKSIKGKNKALADKINQSLKGMQPKSKPIEKKDSNHATLVDYVADLSSKQPNPPLEGLAVPAIENLEPVLSENTRKKNENIDLSKQILRVIKSSTELDVAEVDKKKPSSEYLFEEDAVKNENIDLSNRILRGIKLSTELDVAKVDKKKPSSESLLQEEAALKSSLMISDNRQQSRIVILASAGHGKTTLLRRIAHFYTCENISDPENQLLKNTYNLSGEYLPCLISVRNIGNRRIIMDDIIKSNLQDVFQLGTDMSIQERVTAEDKIKDWVDNWVGAQPHKLLLLIDGLDELSDSARLVFLKELDGYLRLHPQVHVIMSSRVAGLSVAGCKELLEKMKFRGRSLLPLTDDEAKEYAEKWIEVTQPPEEQARQKKSLNQVLTQSRFRHLREFMRTPLELIIILKQLGKDMMSLNRYHMFYDMLWELFTNHETDQRKKKPVFDDLMTILSFVSYQMQLKNALFISKTEIELLVDDLNDLNFYTNITNEGTAEDYIACLDNLAANIGIVERADWESDVVYTLPIRAYQEFLVAYACCHLRLSDDQSRPDAYAVITQHLEDSQWSSITNFVLSDLCINRTNDFDRLMVHLLEKITDLERLKSIVEADLNVNSAHVQVMFKHILGDYALSVEQKSFLLACMNTKSAYAYVGVLKRAYQKSPDSNVLIEANALSKIATIYNDGSSAYDVAMKYLQNEVASDVKMGAAMILCLSKVYLGEELQDFAEIVDQVKNDLRISDDVAVLLSRNAQIFNDAWSMNALTSLWLTKIEGYHKIELFFNETFARVVFKQIDENIPQIKKLLEMTEGRSKEPVYGRIKELFYALGTTQMRCSGVPLPQSNIYAIQLLKEMYEHAKDDLAFDQVALAIAGLNYSGDVDDFIYAWGHDVCKELPTEFVRKDRCDLREQNHFSLVCNRFIKYEKQYRKKAESEANTLNGSTSDSGEIFTLFRSGKLAEAANFCAATMGEIANSNPTNLAFLLRFGKLNAEEIADGQYDIETLLSEGVAKKDRYALLNMALYELENKHYDEAAQLLTFISETGWSAVSNEFWLPELWETDKNPEAALVCVLAHIYGNCDFDDYDEMVEVVKQEYSHLPHEIV